MKKKRSRIAWLCVGIFALLIIIVAIILTHIPITSVLKPMKNPEDIKKIRIEIDRGTDGENIIFELEDSDTIKKITDQLTNIKLIYHGPYNVISYEKGYLIVIHMDDRENCFYINGNGEAYSKNNKFSSNPQIRLLYSWIIENLLIEAEDISSVE